MLRIYHSPGTRSVRPIWLCYELDIPFEIELVDLSSTYRHSPEWRSISPLGKIPAMTDDGVTMIESGAMVEYILARYGNGRLAPPPGSKEVAGHYQWCWFSEAALLRPVGLNHLLREDAKNVHAVAMDAVRRTRQALAVVDRALAKSEFLPGPQFGAADIMMGYALALLDSLKLLDDEYTNARPYLDRLKGRSAFQRALAK